MAIAVTSAVWRRKSIGPSTLPWGMPQSSAEQVHRCLLKTTVCIRLRMSWSRLELIHRHQMCKDVLLECNGPLYQKWQTHRIKSDTPTISKVTDRSNKPSYVISHHLLQAEHRRQFSRWLSLSSGIYDMPLMNVMLNICCVCVIFC